MHSRPARVTTLAPENFRSTVERRPVKIIAKGVGMDATSKLAAGSLSARLWQGSTPIRRAVLAGALSGFVSAGIGSRVVMRIIAALNPDRAGVMTDSNATVGVFSLGGTLSLFALGTTAGVLGGLAYLGLRRWLWVPPMGRGLAFACVTLFTIGQLLFEPANVDFQIFEPVLLIVALFAALFAVNGLVVAQALDRIHPETADSPHPWILRAASGFIVVVCLFSLVGLAGTLRTMVAESGTCYSARGGGNGCAVLTRDVAP